MYATGDLGGALPGVAVAAALAAPIDGGDAPDLILFGTTYDGRDIAGRLSVKLDKPVLTNNIDIEVDGDAVVVDDADLRRHAARQDRSSPAAARTSSLFRPKSFAAEETRRRRGRGRRRSPCPTLGAAGAAKIVDRHVEERTGPKLDEAAIVVSGGRGLGEADKYEMIEELAKLLKGAPGRVPRHRRRRLGALLATRSARPARS